MALEPAAKIEEVMEGQLPVGLKLCPSVLGECLYYGAEQGVNGLGRPEH